MANLFEEKREKLVEQMARILPLIETERQAYIHAEGEDWQQSLEQDIGIKKSKILRFFMEEKAMTWH